MPFSRSKIYLQKLHEPPATILAHLAARFPHVAEHTWRRRIHDKRVILSDGTPVTEHTHYRYGVTVFYDREVCNEPAAAEQGTILFQDSEILVADKPHGIPVTPAGDHVERSLLVQLRRLTANPLLTPLHRLDRDTAGLVLFSTNASSRNRYHSLFQENAIRREYLAIAALHTSTEPGFAWQIGTRIVAGEPWYRQRIVEGPPNANTSIELIDIAKGFGRFRLHPSSGKKHQLRLHMAHIGFHILGDPLYGEAAGLPLQLLAYRLTFTDPRTGRRFSFRAMRTLAGAGDFPDVV